MAPAPRPTLDAFQDSPYAAELQRGVSNRYASPKLEAEYLQARLADARSLVRIACLLSVLVTALRVAEQAIGGWWNPTMRIHLGLVFVISVVLAALAWSRFYERLYLPVAQVGVPARNVIATIPIASAAAHGHVELLMFLPLMVLGPFFFAGLSFRSALISVLMTAVSYIGAIIAFGLETPLALRTSVFLTVAVAACAMAAWQLDKHAHELPREPPARRARAARPADRNEESTRVRCVWQQAIDDGRTIAVLLIDVDHFKAYNDKYGHQAGDQTLRRVAHTLQSFVRRPLDVFARYGGEEFAAILYGVDPTEAHDTAERMRRAVSDLAIEHRASRICAMVTVSVGVAAITPVENRRSRGGVQLADEALYKAKSEGRNRVELMDETEYNVLITGVFARMSSRGSE